MEFLTGLLASIIRPIIQDEINNLKLYMTDLYQTKEKYAEYDKEVETYAPLLANAATSEERWALLSDLKAKRAKLNIK